MAKKKINPLIYVAIILVSAYFLGGTKTSPNQITVETGTANIAGVAQLFAFSDFVDRTNLAQYNCQQIAGPYGPYHHDYKISMYLGQQCPIDSYILFRYTSYPSPTVSGYLFDQLWLKKSAGDTPHTENYHTHTEVFDYEYKCYSCDAPTSDEFEHECLSKDRLSCVKKSDPNCDLNRLYGFEGECLKHILEQCTDSDGGDKPATTGTVNYIYGDVRNNQTDSCDGNSVKEFICDSQQRGVSNLRSCQFGCENGHCKSQTSTTEEDKEPQVEDTALDEATIRDLGKSPIKSADGTVEIYKFSIADVPNAQNNIPVTVWYRFTKPGKYILESHLGDTLIEIQGLVLISENICDVRRKNNQDQDYRNEEIDTTRDGMDIAAQFTFPPHQKGFWDVYATAIKGTCQEGTPKDEDVLIKHKEGWLGQINIGQAKAKEIIPSTNGAGTAPCVPEGIGYEIGNAVGIKGCSFAKLIGWTILIIGAMLTLPLFFKIFGSLMGAKKSDYNK